MDSISADFQAVEIIEPLAEMARQTVDRRRYKNGNLVNGDGYRRWPENAPFDAIIVACAPG